MRSFVNNIATGKSITFNYIGDKLNYIINENQDQKTEFVYTNNILTKIIEKIISSNGVESIQRTRNISNNPLTGNLSQSINTYYYGGQPYVSKNVYNYDTKNNPLANINKYYRINYSSEGISNLSTNNETSMVSYNPSTSVTPTDQYSYQITYNSNQYPTNIKVYKLSTNFLTSDTTIEYY